MQKKGKTFHVGVDKPIQKKHQSHAKLPGIFSVEFSLLWFAYFEKFDKNPKKPCLPQTA
tara:strand:+ start:234 stop:410 length:177 start_codon:yes stop_codon:yes gene_type:complete